MALIAAQMYTLREFCTTPKNVAIAYSKIKKMGYDGVQISGICKMPPEEMRRILDGEGLKCAATHCGMDAFDDMERLKVEHEILGCNYVALGGFFPCKADSTLENWRAFIAKFNEANRKLAGSSLMLGYHNHCHELMQLRPGKERPLDLLFRGLDPTVWFEIDTFWIAAGFADPASWIRKVAGRIPCVHLKDIFFDSMGDGLQSNRLMCEVGDGNLDWPAILDACRYSLVKWYIVERDDGELAPFDSLERSLHNLRERMGM